MTSLADGTAVVEFEDIDSTSLEARRRADAGERGPVWFRADRQTAGRGRDGRLWVSEPGNLYATHLSFVACPMAVTPQLALVAGVALIDALKANGLTPASVTGLRLKWPNDVMVGQDKLAGILAESFSTLDGTRMLTIGFGVNLNAPPVAIGRPVSGLSVLGWHGTPAMFLASLSAALSHWRGIWADGNGFTTVREAWLRHAGPTGTALSVTQSDGARLSGQYVGLDTDGALLMLEAAQQKARRITFGDVSDGFHPPPGPDALGLDDESGI